jgi:4,5-DOPA dioxygenase extradiol
MAADSAGTMPVLFVAHGSPMIAVEDSAYTRFLEQLASTFPKPRAVAIFSAHWEEDVQHVHAGERHSTLYDFGGFPEALYRIRYTPPGDPGLADEVRALLVQAGVPVEMETARGLDHGAWTILARLFPAQDVPVVELSVNAHLTPAEQYAIGRFLAPLRDAGVLVMASGVTVHNFALLRWARDERDPLPLAQAFEAWLDDTLFAWNLDDLFHYADRAPDAAKAVPPQASEHFAPLLYAAGAADLTRRATLLYRDFPWGVMTNTVYRFD